MLILINRNIQLSDEVTEKNIYLSNFAMYRKINLPQYKLTFWKLLRTINTYTLFYYLFKCSVERGFKPFINLIVAWIIVSFIQCIIACRRHRHYCCIFNTELNSAKNCTGINEIIKIICVGLDMRIASKYV